MTSLAGDRSDGGTSARPLVADNAIFFSTAISANGKRSCATCHDPLFAWSAPSRAVSASRSGRVSPGLLSAHGAKFLFWDGRATSLESVVMEVIENENELDGSRLLAAKAALQPGHDISACAPSSRALRVYLDGIPDKRLGASSLFSYYRYLPNQDRKEIDRSFFCVAHVLANFVRAIPDIDTQLGRTNKGQTLTLAAFRGRELFTGKAKCITCHNGPDLTDNQFHNVGIPDIGRSDSSDAGRYDAAQRFQKNPYNTLASDFGAAQSLPIFRINDEMWGAFKTPALRGVSRKVYFMHNGIFSSLDEVVDYYNTLDRAAFPPHHYNGLLTPLQLTKEEIDDLIAFLKTL